MLLLPLPRGWYVHWPHALPRTTRPHRPDRGVQLRRGPRGRHCVHRVVLRGSEKVIALAQIRAQQVPYCGSTGNRAGGLRLRMWV